MVLMPETSEVPVDLASAIADLKRDLNATVMAHYYQVGEVQDVADFIGDSLQLARQAAETEAEVIVFAGVHFMAESAKILAPEKLVLLPDLEAGCSLAESAPAREFRQFVEAHPDHTVVTYVNSTAAVKALSDYCCTSSNAVEVVRHLGDRPIIFAPDRFLGDWVKRETGRDDILLWEGSCEVHELFSEEAIVALKQEHPGCITLVHPECPQHLRVHADVVGSTRKLLDAVRAGAAEATWLVVTEPGIIHQMRKVAPQATFLEAPAMVTGSQEGSCTSCNECPHMKRNTLEKLWRCMVERRPRIELHADTIARARRPIERMLAIG